MVDIIAIRIPEIQIDFFVSHKMFDGTCILLFNCNH